MPPLPKNEIKYQERCQRQGNILPAQDLVAQLEITLKSSDFAFFLSLFLSDEDATEIAQFPREKIHGDLFWLDDGLLFDSCLCIFGGSVDDGRTTKNTKHCLLLSIKGIDVNYAHFYLHNLS